MQVIVALVVTPEGLPLACKKSSGNTKGKTTLRGGGEGPCPLRCGPADLDHGPLHAHRGGADGTARGCSPAQYLVGILANAGRHSAVSYERAGEQLRQVELEIEQLLAKAEAADAAPLQHGQTIQDELTRRQARKAALARARTAMEARARPAHRTRPRPHKLRQQTVELVFGVIKA